MRIFLSLLAFTTSFLITAQDYTRVAKEFLIQNNEIYNLDYQDLNNIKISSSSFSKSLNAQTVYITQYYQGVAIDNSSSMFLIRDNEVIKASLSFENNLSNRINSTNYVIDTITAIHLAADLNGLSYENNTTAIGTDIDGFAQFSNSSLSLKPITVKPTYINVENALRLAWQVYIETIDNLHMYLIYIDGETGEIIKKRDLVLSCNFNGDHNHHYNEAANFTQSVRKSQTAATFMDNSQYNVYALPLESPNHGNESVITSPADPVASPFGWHDTDAATGPDFTITRGNNVFAQDDFDGDGSTIGASPDGSIALNFNFPQQLDVPARDNINGSTVNLFYMNNMMHDIWYHYGFDEASGNFQSNNYSNGGLDNDFVVADAQDGSGFNNATFGTPADGGNPRMNMFLWNAPTTGGVDLLTLNNSNLAGSYDGEPAAFGSSLPNPSTPLIADLALVIDDNSGGVSTDTSDACDVITNGNSLSGKIVVMRRGNCQFGTKVLAAENQGAIAVIVVNNAPTNPIAMAPGNDGDLVTIPSIMISQADGNLLITALQNGTIINASLNNTGLFRKDGSLDNGIVAHEYGHGISTRLTGGPANPSCLSNIEQMGEGWSDWFSLIITIEPGDQGTDIRGIGTYATNQSTTGPGIRNFPYSTDLNINPVTYGDTNNANFSAPHGLGSIWASMLWDLSWRFISDYGYDPDLFNGTGGNNIAMQLIMDGMKIQPCNPGFVDGRDAILQADMLSNGGINHDRIWEVFAARGLGFSASQGNSDSRFDQIEAFDTPAPLSNTSESIKRFNISPNPTNGIISIASNTEIGDGLLTIYDFNGRKVLSKKSTFNTVESVDLTSLEAGIYLIAITGTNTNYVAKIIVN
ncbi:T9SS-dependent M36 family metallopeptidase [Nonlabens mediterrranea]|uniref:T9SS-dependent M36 family metallopeptidase n=2 Tax=Nonlabens mediterrranea TaxID=1419947 RepID=A0ABS0A297_9FLAO|nr:T9SS-dependent M36 family metallopeptidase [Nonlabens mediterrranea]